MADVQSSLISAIIGGVIVAIINNLFVRSNKDNEWRSQHLSEDKEKIREECMKIFNDCEGFDLIKLIEKIKNNQDLLNLIATLHSSYYVIELYLDKQNVISDKLQSAVYSTIQDIDNLLQMKIALPQMQGDIATTVGKDYFLLHSRVSNQFNQFKKAIREYFAEYYPKPPLCTRIKQCFCGN